MITRRFTESDQRLFAALSGDQNPIYLDPRVARRSASGVCVVHGAHVGLWSLERALADGLIETSERPARIVASFARPIRVGHDVTATPVRSANELRVAFSDRGGAAGSIAVVFGGPTGPTGNDPVGAPVRIGRPESPDLRRPVEGAFPLLMPRAKVERLFPRLLAWIGPHAVASLMASSTVVGMRCPGLRSTVLGWEAEIGAERGDDGRLVRYVVRAFDETSGLARITLKSGAITIAVSAFARPGEVSQPSASRLASCIDAGAFRGVRALVIGGSRGLGEVATKLLALGGADVVFTFREGEPEARKVVSQLSTEGRVVRAVRHDVDRPGLLGGALALHAFSPNALYYFASPPIFVGGPVFDEALFDRFVATYVHGFEHTVRSADRGRLEAVFYPSADALEPGASAPPEYLRAKREGEAACARLRRQRPTLRVLDPRLPRVLTDQTASTMPARCTSPVDALLPHLRAMHDARPVEETQTLPPPRIRASA